MRFTPVASSSAGCAYILHTPGSQPLLVDCGVTIKSLRPFLPTGVTSLAACLVSHAHGDHSLLAGDLTRRGVDCIMSKETMDTLVSKWRATAGDASRILAIGHLETASFDGWSIKAFDAVHDSPGTLGFIVGDQSGDRLLYLTDSAYSRHTFTGLTHIAVECNYSEDQLRESALRKSIHAAQFRRTFQTHMSLERLVEMLKSNDLSRVREIHLLHLSDRHGDEDSFRREVAKATGKPVFVAPRGAA